jgi:tetratricopeptide (TPR) repeat protein
MKCTNCGSELIEGNNRCNICGQEVKVSAAVPAVKPKKNKWASLVIFLVFIAISAYNGFSNVGVQKNETGIDLLDKGGDYNQAIQSFSEAYGKVTSDEDKITVLKNWAYAYWANNQLPETKAKFQEALAMIKPESSDYYLVTGEIALLDNDAQKAEENYMKAVAKAPNDFQINTSLGVFYMGLDEFSADYAEYDKALIYNKKAYEVKPESEMVKENLASNYFYLEKYQEAIDLFSLTSLDKKPYNNYMIGLCYLGLENNESAKLYVQKAMDAGFEAEPKVLEYLGLQNNLE